MTNHRRRALLLINLGTPQAPDRRSVGKYLRQFLMDKHVITFPIFFRWILVNLIIVPFRAKHSAKNYERIWVEGDSPLRIHTMKLAGNLSKALEHWGVVGWAMRYGEPSIERQLRELFKLKIDELYLMPLYPQFAYSTTETAIEKALKTVRKEGFLGKVFVKNSFFKDQYYIKVMQQKLKEALKNQPKSHVLFSFHGLPESHLKRRYKGCLSTSNCCDHKQSDRGCYKAQCVQSATILAQKCDLNSSNYSVSFQSRIGREEWIRPYTCDQVQKVCKDGIKNLIVIAPSFVADCLESLDELGVELREQFEKLGGSNFHLVPGLNSEDLWVQSLAQMVEASSSPWSQT